MRRNEDIDEVNSSQTEGNDVSFDMKQSPKDLSNDVRRNFILTFLVFTFYQYSTFTYYLI